MKWIQLIKDYLYKRSLNKVLNPSFSHKIINLTDAKHVGLLYDYNNQTEVDTIAKELTELGKEVTLCCLYTGKEKEKPSLPHVFTSKEVTWANVPVAALAGKFAATSFDLLLCAYTTPQPTLEYMAATSKARWRVGTYRAGKEHCYDMMINLEKTTDVKYFWNQAKHFLNNIEYA